MYFFPEELQQWFSSSFGTHKTAVATQQWIVAL